MTQLVKKINKIFREEERTESVTLGDLDIVKISTLSWVEKDEMNFSKKFICSTFCLSLVVIIVQVSIMVSLISDVTDIMFCGDVVKHINMDDPEHFFLLEGKDTH